MRRLFAEDVLYWRLAGALVWQALTVAALESLLAPLRWPTLVLSPTRLFSTVLNPRAWVSLMATCALLTPSTLAHAFILTSREPIQTAPHWLRYFPRRVATLCSKTAARLTTLPEALSMAACLAAHAASAALFLLHRSFPALEVREAGVMGLCLAVAYHAHAIYWSKDVALFPTLQRHRYFRIKQQFLPTLPRAGLVALLAFVLRALASPLFGVALPLPGGLLVLAWPCWACVVFWMAGSLALEVVFTERLKPGDYGSRDALKGLQECLSGRRGSFLQDLALHDLSLMASDRGKAAWRRAEVFADELGAQWSPLAGHCIDVLSKLSSAIAGTKTHSGGEAFSGQSGQRKAEERAEGSTASSGAKWNMLPSAMTLSAPTTQRHVQLGVAAVSAGCQRGRLAARALTDFALASLSEDRFGVLQLSEPNLGDLLVCLLGTLASVQQVERHAGSCSAALGPWRGTGDAAYGSGDASGAVFALKDELTTCLYALVRAFGAELREVMGKAMAQKGPGQEGKTKVLLEKFLRGDE